MGSFGFVGSIWISCTTSPPCGCILMLSVVSSILEPLSSGSAVTTVEASKVSIQGFVWYLLCLLSSISPAKFHFLLLLPLKTPHSCPHFVCDIESWDCVSGSWYIDDVIFLLVSSILGFDKVLPLILGILFGLFSSAPWSFLQYRFFWKFSPIYNQNQSHHQNQPIETQFWVSYCSI